MMCFEIEGPVVKLFAQGSNYMSIFISKFRRFVGKKLNKKRFGLLYNMNMNMNTCYESNIYWYVH